jgi:hypothetical protein
MTLHGWWFWFNRASTQGAQSPAINKSGPGDVNVRYGWTSEQGDEFAAQIAAQVTAEIAAQLNAVRTTTGLPNGERSVAQAVGSIAAEAGSGNVLLRQALDSLAAGNPDGAAPLLQAFAETKAAQIARDRKEVAIAYRKLGAIASLRDPKRALDAYVHAADLDPDDLGSELWAGWLAKERGELVAAEVRLSRVLAQGADDDWLHWARLVPYGLTLGAFCKKSVAIETPQCHPAYAVMA